MKILHYSDKSSPDFFTLYRQCDILICTGDLMSFDFAGLQDLPNKKPAFGVYGNHDSGNYMDSLGVINLHDKIVEYSDLKWGGFQGCIKYKESPLMYTEDQAREWSTNFPAVDVLLLHASPRGMLDDPSDYIHTGSESVRNYVLEKKPKYIFCGHQYSDDYLEIGETKIYRSYGARLIEIG